MANTIEGVQVAAISENVAAVVERLGEHKEVQQNILVVLNQLLETNEAQSEMLAEIMAAASQEAGPSPVAEALNALVVSVERLVENQTILLERIVELPNAIGQQFEITLRDRAQMSAH